MPFVDDSVFLLVEDREDDIFVMKNAFKAAGVARPVRYVKDGEETIAYLKGEGVFGNRSDYPLPFVVLLDLNMPRKSGFEVLEWMRSQPMLKRIVVLILTASTRSCDTDRAYDLGANFYLTKPGTFEELVKLLKCLQGWVALNEFPSAVERPPSW